MAKKYIGWGMASETDGTKEIVIVQGKSRNEAVDNLERLGYDVIDKASLNHVCIVKYPGPPEVKAMKAQNWEKAFKPAGKPDEKTEQARMQEYPKQ